MQVFKYIFRVSSFLFTPVYVQICVNALQPIWWEYSLITKLLCVVSAVIIYVGFVAVIDKNLK